MKMKVSSIPDSPERDHRLVTPHIHLPFPNYPFTLSHHWVIQTPPFYRICSNHNLLFLITPLRLYWILDELYPQLALIERWVRGDSARELRAALYVCFIIVIVSSVLTAPRHCRVGSPLDVHRITHRAASYNC